MEVDIEFETPEEEEAFRKGREFGRRETIEEFAKEAEDRLKNAVGLARFGEKGDQIAIEARCRALVGMVSQDVAFGLTLDDRLEANRKQMKSYHETMAKVMALLDEAEEQGYEKDDVQGPTPVREDL